MQTYFHVCPIPLGDGSVIKAGNFGRVIDCYRPDNLNPLALREMVFETMRLKYFASLPSRLTSIFLLPSFEHAARYRAAHGHTSLIYEVQLNEDKPVFHGDMQVVTTPFPSPQISAIPFLLGIANQYWQGSGALVDTSELLTESSVTVLRMIDDRLQAGE